MKMELTPRTLKNIIKSKYHSIFHPCAVVHHLPHHQPQCPNEYASNRLHQYNSTKVKWRTARSWENQPVLFVVKQIWYADDSPVGNMMIRNYLTHALKHRLPAVNAKRPLLPARWSLIVFPVTSSCKVSIKSWILAQLMRTQFYVPEQQFEFPTENFPSKHCDPATTVLPCSALQFKRNFLF